MDDDNPMNETTGESAELKSDAPRYRRGALLCNAKNNTCKKLAMTKSGKTKCRSHGGATPRGPAHGAYKNGTYSTYLPAGLKLKYNAALQDSALTEYRQDIALFQSRLCQLLESGESQPLWELTAATFTDLEQALAQNDPMKVRDAMNRLHSLVRRGNADSLRWREIYEVAEQLTRVKEREHKRLVAMEQLLTAEQFMAFIALITDVAKRTITDRDQLRAFTSELGTSWDRKAQSGAGTDH